jgi:hypothetical protein
VREARQYALHALTTRLVKEFDVIAIEDLNVRALARGRSARAIQDAAFGVDAGDACPEEHILVQVLAEEARSGHPNRAGLDPARSG